MQEEKVVIEEKKEKNQYDATNVFKLTIDFQCVDKYDNYEEEVKFLEVWLPTWCFDKICIEVAEMNVEDNIDDEKINEIFMYWSPEEMKLYYELMLRKILMMKNTL